MAKKDKEEMDFDEAYLKGLTYRNSEGKKVKDENTGKMKTVYIPYERPLTKAEVIKFEDMGTEVKIVTADGRKYILPKIKEGKK